MRKRVALVVTAALSVAAAAWAIDTYRISYPNREHAMTELTKTMRPYCIGRFLIEVPRQAKLEGLSQAIMGMGTIEVATNITHATYELRAKDKEAALRAQPHEKEGTVLKDVWRPEGVDATFLTFRDDKYSTEQFSMLAYLWREGQMLTFHYGASNDGIEKSKDELLRAFSKIEPRDNDQIPQSSGACIDNAFVTGSGYRAESVGGTFEFPDYPRLTLAVSADVTERPDTEGLLARAARHKRAIDINYPDMKVRALRSAKRTVNGLAGEELVQVVPADKGDPYRQGQGNSYTAVWESNGIAKSMEKPEVRISLNYDDGALEGKKLTEEQLLALWDAIVNSFRPRPGAF